MTIPETTHRTSVRQFPRALAVIAALGTIGGFIWSAVTLLTTNNLMGETKVDPIVKTEIYEN